MFRDAEGGVGDELISLVIMTCYAHACFPGVAHTVKNLPEKRETQVRSLGWEDPLQKGVATHSSILAWRIPMDSGAWQATVHGVSKSRTWLTTKHSHLALWLSTWAAHIPRGGLPGRARDEESACQTGSRGLIPGSRRSPAERNGHSLQYSCLGNPMEKEAWYSTIDEIAEELEETLRPNDNKMPLAIQKDRERKSRETEDAIAVWSAVLDRNRKDCIRKPHWTVAWTKRQFKLDLRRNQAKKTENSKVLGWDHV